MSRRDLHPARRSIHKLPIKRPGLATVGAVAARLSAPDYPLQAAAGTCLAALSAPAGAPLQPVARSVQVAPGEHILVRLPLRAADGRVIGQA